MNKDKTARIYILILMLFVSIVFSSFGNIVNVADRTLVHGLGIDVTENGYRVSMQVFKSSGAGSDTPVDASQSNTKILQGEGRTVDEAIASAQLKEGKELFLGHLRFICFSKDVDFSSPEQLLSFVNSQRSVYLGVRLCMSEGSAEEIINAQITNGVTSADSIAKILEENENKGSALGCQIIDLLATEQTPQFLAMPVVKAIEQENSFQGGEQSSQGEQASQSGQEEPEIRIVGSALIKEGKALDYILTPEECEGASWLTKQTKESLLVVTHGGELVNAKLKRDGIKIRLENSGGRLIYKAKIYVVADVSKDITDKKQSEQMEKEIEQAFSELIYKSWEKVFWENSVDIFGIWKMVRSSFPKSYLQYEENLEELYSPVDFKLEIVVRVG